uniref:Putative salivary secreted protein n=1 Tax=Panstrongylus lignarius TaxID=156445 RepID=A0A224XPA1_9HEMI
MTRGIFITLLLVSCLYVTCGRVNKKHNLILGRRGPNDKVLYRRTITKTNWNPIARTGINVIFPGKKRAGYRPIITEIDAIDLDNYDKGGYVSILKGGIHRDNVLIRFKTQLGRGLKFRLTIYGHD